MASRFARLFPTGPNSILRTLTRRPGCVSNLLGPHGFLSTTPASTSTKAQTSIPPAPSSIDDGEMDRFDSLASEWWNEFGPMSALHSMNDVRVPWITTTMTDHYGLTANKVACKLKDQRILDVGCGAGILSEPLARIGATVLGIDGASETIDAAKEHAESDPDLHGRLSYQCSSVEELDITSESTPPFDAVVASEIVEHVTDPADFISACFRVLRPGGLLFVTTLNRTVASQVLGIWAAERILRVVPEGIHDWNKFVTPGELKSMVERAGGSVRMVHGLRYNPFTNRWDWQDARLINYALCAVKIE